MTRLEGVRDRLHAVAGGFPRPFWFLFAGTFVNRLGTFVVPFLTLYLTQVRGYSILQAGMVASLYGVGASIAAPLGGTLADHVGRRFTMVFALALGGLGMIALGFARELHVIAAATFGVALVSEMYRPGVQAVIADLIPPEDRVRAFGLVYWVVNLGFGVGLAIGGWLATVSFTLAFVADGITSLLFALLVWVGVPETRPAHARAAAAHEARSLRTTLEGILAPYRDGPFVAFLALCVCIFVVFMQHGTTFPLDLAAHGVSRAWFGIVLGLNGIIVVLVQPFAGPVFQRWDRSRSIVLGTLLVGVGFGLNAVARDVPLYVLGVIIWSVGEVPLLPVANALVADLAPIERRGRYQGAYGLSFSLAVAIAPIAGSWVLQRLGGTVLWLGCLGVALLVALGQAAIAPALRREREARAALRPAT